MALEILTREDFVIFKAELFQELGKLFNAPAVKSRKWLKSHEVRELLSISPGTLQNMRINGTLAYTKIGGLIFYDQDEILKLLDGKKKSVKHS
ncbi:Helix-turn-helix domain-containing protein [Chitinophaga ginsengisegetis]|uniref:Helix-turn-helix domain-containing protein n=1 Tax=Chitinophaga ginsengisegetis TaxID=393003 RepID=A0A1T5P9J5_9BACT|nr:helix-turn-helix domain-containing protein [Chitinophaga ginsengisegetis]SKD09414.1 Helix-turn-helix domain-containing protein [Chitinophaga ginsengisegetis]